jgi:hypothetical protein
VGPGPERPASPFENQIQGTWLRELFDSDSGVGFILFYGMETGPEVR